MLIQVERTGAEQRGGQFIHSEDAKEYLVQHLGVQPQAIRIKTSGRNELKDENLLNPLSSVQYYYHKQSFAGGVGLPFCLCAGYTGKI